MVSVNKLQEAVIKFIDEDIYPKIPDGRRWLFIVGLYAKLEELPAKLTSLGMANESGDVDVDKLYKLFQLAAKKGAETFDIPMIGKITLAEKDVERLYSIIKDM